MAFTICSEAEITFMAGENADATGNVTANRQFLHDYAAAYLSMLIEYDVLTNWAILNAVEKELLTEWTARFAGAQLVAFNPAGYTTLIEAEDIIQVHIYRLEQIEKVLKQVGARKRLGGS